MIHKATLTGYCRNPECGAPTERIYCSSTCGRRYRYITYYKETQLQLNQNWKQKRKQNSKSTRRGKKRQPIQYAGCTKPINTHARFLSAQARYKERVRMT